MCIFSITGKPCQILALWKRFKGLRLTFQLTSPVANNRYDFTSQNKFVTGHSFTNSFYEKGREEG